MSAASEWQRISSQGRLIYWRRTLRGGTNPGGLGYLTVSRITDESSPDHGRWQWGHRGPEHTPEDGYRLKHAGMAGSVPAAKRYADAYAASLEPQVAEIER